MSDEECTIRQLLLSYVALLAERHAYAPDENFEYALWDDLLLKKPTLVSVDEKKELITLIVRGDVWVTYDYDSRMFKLIDIDDWRILLKHRSH
jgi:hypothetical protein